MINNTNVVPDDPVDHITRIASYSGDKFKDLFYFTFDQHREELIHFFREHSIIVWNGNRLTGLQRIREFFKAMPATKHEVHALDSQVIRDLTNGDSPGVLVIAVGTVQYGISEKSGFHHSFTLTRDTTKDLKNKYYVASYSIRRSKADRIKDSNHHHNHHHHHRYHKRN